MILVLDTPITLEAKRDAHMGPRWEFAHARVRFEPTQKFDVRVENLVEVTDNTAEYQTGLIAGILGPLMSSPHEGIPRLKIIIELLKEHPIDSNQASFKWVGNQIGRELIELGDFHEESSEGITATS